MERAMTSLVPVGRASVARPASRVPAPAAGRRARTAADVMTRSPLALPQQASLFSAWDRLHGSRHGHLVLVDRDQRPAGVLDLATIALEWPSGPLEAHRTPAHRLLRGRVRPRVRSGDDLETVARVMLGAEADAVPVVDGSGRLLGLVTLWHYVESAARGDTAPVRSAAGPGRPSA